MRRRSLKKLAEMRSNAVSKRHRQVGKTGSVMFYDAKDVEVILTDPYTGEKTTLRQSTFDNEAWEPPPRAIGVIIKT